jgi:hypothetical protein
VGRVATGKGSLQEWGHCRNGVTAGMGLLQDRNKGGSKNRVVPRKGEGVIQVPGMGLLPKGGDTGMRLWG